LAVAEQLKCCAIVNDVSKRDGPGGRDFNVISDTPKQKKFIHAMKEVADTTGHTLVVWIHGAKDSAVNLEANDKRSAFKGKQEDLHALIGYGQGPKPLKKGTSSKFGEQLIITDPKINKWIGKSGQKNDTIDVEKLPRDLVAIP
jgi:hypothetical protein